VGKQTVNKPHHPRALFHPVDLVAFILQHFTDQSAGKRDAAFAAATDADSTMSHGWTSRAQMWKLHQNIATVVNHYASCVQSTQTFASDL